MDAMILAAGLGTRLAPLTDHLPKALVKVAGIPMLERTARRLIAAGADRLVINLFAFPEQIEAFVRKRANFGVEVRFSREPRGPLETGGGLRAARALLRADGPTILHNVDVFTDLPLRAMLGAHERTGALVTLAVMERETARCLLFDEVGLLGRVDRERDVRIQVRRPQGSLRTLPFCGVHVLSAPFLDQISERGRFSILDPYLRLAQQGAPILPFPVDGCTWVDIGRPAQLAHAECVAAAGAGR